MVNATTQNIVTKPKRLKLIIDTCLDYSSPNRHIKANLPPSGAGPHFLFRSSTLKCHVHDTQSMLHSPVTIWSPVGSVTHFPMVTLIATGMQYAHHLFIKCHSPKDFNKRVA